MQLQISEEILNIIENLKKSGFQAFIVGGSVRDILLAAQEGEPRPPRLDGESRPGQGRGREPKDWDIATSAKPEEIQKIFPDSVYENKFGTVLVKLKPQINADITQTVADEEKKLHGNIQRNSALSPRSSALNVVEITTFRLEGKYTDFRHPDKIEFAKTIEEDLARRDFTVNAIALALEAREIKNLRPRRIRLWRKKPRPEGASPLANLAKGGRLAPPVGGAAKIKIIDPFDGQEDLKNKIIQTVGSPEARFNEDALRLVRAVRFAAELKFEIEGGTKDAIKKYARLLEVIAKERIRDEFTKIIMSDNGGPAWGVAQLEELGLLKYIIPELREGIGVTQNKHHIYTVWDHNLRALNYAAGENYDLDIRLASLLHDVGKPRAKEGEGPDSTFYAHEIIGARITARILDRLHFPKKTIEKVVHLVRQHLFYYNVGEVTESGVRKFLSRVGAENVPDLLKVREADRIGSGVPKAVPYKTRHLLFMIEKVKADPISPKMLEVNGGDLMKILNILPCPRIGWILAILLEEVLDDPKKNTKENLEFRIRDLGKLSDNELEKLSGSAREKKEEFESGIESEMKKKYYVR